MNTLKTYFKGNKKNNLHGVDYCWLIDHLSAYFSNHLPSR